MTKEQLNSLEELLDESYALAVKRDEELGNGKNLCFHDNNTYYIHYCGILAACTALGLYADKRVDVLTQRVVHKLY